MGMVLGLRTASDATIEKVLADPELVEGLLFPEDEPEEGEVTDEGLQVDLDKAWHAIHFMLCGSAEEKEGVPGFLLSGGTVVGDVDVGYGPARAMTSEEVRAASRYLDALPTDTFMQRYDAQKLDGASIYPEIWVRDGPDGAAYVREYYDTLRQFMNTAARKKMGMLVALT